MSQMTDEQVDAPKWIDVRTELPTPEKKVLVYYRNSHGNARIVRAMWATQDSLENEFSDDELPAGWYEANDNEETHFLIHDEVTHWMPLPRPPSFPAGEEA